MATKNFNGQLASNEIFSALYDMIISQQVFADNIAGTKSTLVDMARVDGGLYGDTKLYYATDVLKSAPWGNDEEATNLLKLYRPDDPKCQPITIDTFRQISLTVDNYLSKRAFSTEGAFSSFNSVMLGWIGDTKKIYDSTTYNVAVGTTETDVGKQKQEIDVTTATQGLTGEEKARVEGATIAEGVANLLVDLTDVSRDFNDYGFLRSYNVDDLLFIWSSKAVSSIERRDLPTIYHKEIIDKFAQHTLPSRYFGTINAGATDGNGTTVRSLIEQDVKQKSGTGTKHVFAGDLIPTGYTAGANTSYTEDATILFKVIHKNSMPFMSAFEVGTSFYNPKSLTENHYLTWGHNTPEHLANYPFITVRKK